MKKGSFFIAVTVVVGILLGLQVRSFRKVAFLAERASPGDIIGELRVFQIANEKLRDQIKEEGKKFEELNPRLASAAAEEIEHLKLLSGEESVSGEGIEVTLGGEVQEFWIIDLIAHLVSGGAEAISVNGVRLVNSTAGFRSVGGGLVMRRHFLRPPFHIVAIGPRSTLKQSVSQTGGILDRIQNAYIGMQVIVSEILILKMVPSALVSFPLQCPDFLLSMIYKSSHLNLE